MFGSIKKEFLLRNIPKELRSNEQYMEELNAEGEALAKEPVNLLEASLVHLQLERSDRALRVFTEHLVSSNIRVMSNCAQIDGMLIIDVHGSPSVALYTDNIRANRMRERLPEYKYLLTIPFADLIRFVPPSLGMVVNPLWKVVYFYMNQGQVGALRKGIASNEAL